MRNIKFSFCLFLLITISFSAYSQVNIIPKPNDLMMTPDGGAFKITPQTKIVIKDKSLTSTAEFLNNYLREVYGFELTTTPVGNGKNLIVLQLDKNAPKTKGAYTLISDKKFIAIKGGDASGTFYGMQTLLQLLPTTPSKSLEIASLTIKDAPRFEYRGLMLDVSRHFFSCGFC